MGEGAREDDVRRAVLQGQDTPDLEIHKAEKGAHDADAESGSVSDITTLTGGIIRYLFEPLSYRTQQLLRRIIIGCAVSIGLVFTTSFVIARLVRIVEHLTSLFG